MLASLPKDFSHVFCAAWPAFLWLSLAGAGGGRPEGYPRKAQTKAAAATARRYQPKTASVWWLRKRMRKRTESQAKRYQTTEAHGKPGDVGRAQRGTALVQIVQGCGRQDRHGGEKGVFSRRLPFQAQQHAAQNLNNERDRPGHKAKH